MQLQKSQAQKEAKVSLIDLFVSIRLRASLSDSVQLCVRAESLLINQHHVDCFSLNFDMIRQVSVQLLFPEIKVKVQ